MATGRVRWLGLVVGMAIGFLFSGISPFATDSMRFNPFPIASVAAGGLGGFLMARSAWRARSRSAWAGVVFGLAFVAVVIGDLVVASLMAIFPNQMASPDLVTRLGESLTLFTFGLLVVGWLMFFVAMFAATLWALVMWAIRGDVESPLAETKPLPTEPAGP